MLEAAPSTRLDRDWPDFFGALCKRVAGGFDALAELQGNRVRAVGQNIGDVAGLLLERVADPRRAVLDGVGKDLGSGFQCCLEGGGALIEGQIQCVDVAAKRGIHGADARIKRGIPWSRSGLPKMRPSCRCGWQMWC